MDPENPESSISETGSTFGDWLRREMERQNVSIPDLVAKTGITYPGIWNIVKGNTASPRQETREKLARALDEQVPLEIEKQIEIEATSVPGLTWVDFTPSDLETIPQTGGVYVFYDITDRPVYVGMSKNNVRNRVKDHQTRFWFKEPLVVRGALLTISDGDLCSKIEVILIKFLGKHALLNSRGVIRDQGD